MARCQARQVVPGQQRTSEGDLCHVLGWSFDKACKAGHPLFLSGRVGSKFLFKNLGLFHQVSLELELAHMRILKEYNWCEFISESATLAKRRFRSS